MNKKMNNVVKTYSSSGEDDRFIQILKENKDVFERLKNK